MGVKWKEIWKLELLEGALPLPHTSDPPPPCLPISPLALQSDPEGKEVSEAGVGADRGKKAEGEGWGIEGGECGFIAIGSRGEAKSSKWWWWGEPPPSPVLPHLHSLHPGRACFKKPLLFWFLKSWIFWGRRCGGADWEGEEGDAVCFLKMRKSRRNNSL